MNLLSILALKTKTKGNFVGSVTDSFPTTRPDGTSLENYDYVRPTGTFPLTIDDITFTSSKDIAYYINGTWMLDGEVHIISKSNVDDNFFTDNILKGTTNAENVVVSGDLTSDGDLSITNATVSGELDVPTPTSDNMAANKKYVDGKFGYVDSVDGYLNFYSDSSKTTLIQSIEI